ncbi:MAG: hypothetical protein AB7G75_01335 [Candidatus Binatia bacterium]
MSPEKQNGRLNLRVGEVVAVRSAREILATLDQAGTCEGLLMMPEMLRYCGKQFTVFKRSDKTCDTVRKTGLRRMQHTVHLQDVRCNGDAHGGCEAGCLIFWHEAWLQRIPSNTTEPQPQTTDSDSGSQMSETEVLATPMAMLEKATRHAGTTEPTDDVRYRCQATELLQASSPLSWWDIRHYVRDVRAGNIGVLTAVIDYGCTVLIRVFNTLQRWRGGREYPPLFRGILTKTPSGTLRLQPGERVQVKSKEEIRQTLDTANRNRGLHFDSEMLPYCGRTFTVLRRVGKIINERNGTMMRLPNDCVILDGVICAGKDHQYCPRSIYPYWRELWLRRVTADSSRQPSVTQGTDIASRSMT